MCGVISHISKMGDKKYICISEESVFCPSLSGKEMQNEKDNASYPKSKKPLKQLMILERKKVNVGVHKANPRSLEQNLILMRSLLKTLPLVLMTL